MTERQYLDYIQDIIESVNDIESFVSNMNSMCRSVLRDPWGSSGGIYDKCSSPIPRIAADSIPGLETPESRPEGLQFLAGRILLRDGGLIP